MKFDARRETKETIGKYMELFTPECYTEEELYRWIGICKEYKLRSYIVYSHWLPIIAKELKGTNVRVGAGGGFPLGMDTPKAKAQTMADNVEMGCTTLDLTMNQPAFLSGRYDIVDEELTLFKKVAGDIETKLIIEVFRLSDEQIALATKMAVDHGIDWVKSSTGQFQGPTMQQCKIILDNIKGSNTRLKVSGVKFPRPQNAYAFLSAGAEIIGSQGVVEIIETFDLLKELGVLPS